MDRQPYYNNTPGQGDIGKYIFFAFLLVIILVSIIAGTLYKLDKTPSSDKDDDDADKLGVWVPDYYAVRGCRPWLLTYRTDMAYKTSGEKGRI